MPEMCCPVQRHNVLLDLWSFTVDWHLQELSPISSKLLNELNEFHGWGVGFYGALGVVDLVDFCSLLCFTR